MSKLCYQRQRVSRGRLRAAFFWSGLCATALLLSACGNGLRPPIASLLDLLPGGGDAARRAARLPYASIDMSIGGSSGLLVLAQLHNNVTYWQSANRTTIALDDGYLSHTAGLPTDLLMTRVISADIAKDLNPWQMATAGEPLTYKVQRQWQTVAGMPRTEVAAATLVCQSQPTRVTLPLATLALQRCRQTLRWPGGNTTQATLWRSPETHRLWAVTTVPWPGAPRFEWEVARPWW